MNSGSVFNPAIFDPCTEDLNKNGMVDIIDALTASVSYGTASGDSNYNPDADVDGSGVVNLFDLSAIAFNYGKAC